jgi:hypothetical protein
MGLLSMLLLAAPCSSVSDCAQGQQCIASVCQEAQAQPAARPIAAPKRYEFTLANGSKLVGRLMDAPDPSQVRVQLLDGTTRTLFRADILAQRPFTQAKVGADGNVWENNPNRTRHIYAPSAMPLKAGEGYGSIKEFLFASGAVGITDNISVLVGSFIPTLFAGLELGGLIGAIKVSGEVGEDLYFGVGGEVITLPSFGSGPGLNVMGIGFGAVTFGKPDKQFTLSAGRPFLLSAGDANNDLGDVLFVAAGQLRVSNSYGLVTENWIFPTTRGPAGDSFLSLHALAMRYMGDNMAFDFGFIGVGGIPFMMPWLDWTWHLGTARR